MPNAKEISLKEITLKRIPFYISSLFVTLNSFSEIGHGWVTVTRTCKPKFNLISLVLKTINLNTFLKVEGFGKKVPLTKIHNELKNIPKQFITNSNEYFVGNV